MEPYELVRSCEFSQLRKYSSRRSSPTTYSFLSNKYIQDDIDCFDNGCLHFSSYGNMKTKKTSKWNTACYRDSNGEDILKPCFKKPIYLGNSNFNYLPKIIEDNLEWFKRRKISLGDESNSEYDIFQKSILVKKKKEIMVKPQENSKYKYISPFSEYLLKRMNWKIALRVYYSLDPDKKGFIELATLKNELLTMLKTDTEKAQILLMLVENITPFYIKGGYIYKDEIVSFIAKKISEESVGYGLFSKLKTVFMNPICRSKKICGTDNGMCVKLYNSKDSGAFHEDRFTLNPEIVVLKLSEMRIYNPYRDYFNGFCGTAQNKDHNNCLQKYGFCKTNVMKYSVKGSLQDHINMSKERKRMLIDRIMNERKEKESKPTFKPEIIWPLEDYIMKNSNKNRGIKNYSRKCCKEEINVMGYKVVKENSMDQNIELPFNNSVQSCNFSHKSCWNDYIDDFHSNNTYVIHKGHSYNYRKSDDNILYNINSDSNKESDSKLQSIVVNFINDFFEIEKEINGEKNGKNSQSKIKLIDKLRTERKSSFYDPRFKNTEYDIDNNTIEFKEKVLYINELPTYKEVANHSTCEMKHELSNNYSYYYLPKGYEQITNYFNEWNIRRKIIPVNNILGDKQEKFISLTESIRNNIEKENDTDNDNSISKLNENFSEKLGKNYNSEAFLKNNANSLKKNETNTNLKVHNENSCIKTNSLIKIANLKSDVNQVSISKSISIKKTIDTEQNSEINNSAIVSKTENVLKPIQIKAITNKKNLPLMASKQVKCLSKIENANKLNKKILNDLEQIPLRKKSINKVLCNCEKATSKNDLNLKNPFKMMNLTKNNQNNSLLKTKQLDDNLHTETFQTNAKNDVCLDSLKLNSKHLDKFCTNEKSSLTFGKIEKSCLCKIPSKHGKSVNLLKMSCVSNSQNQLQTKMETFHTNKPSFVKCLKDIDAKNGKFNPEKSYLGVKKQSFITKIKGNLPKLKTKSIVQINTTLKSKLN